MYWAARPFQKPGERGLLIYTKVYRYWITWEI